MSDTTQKTYWRSLESLANSKAYKEYAEREFPDGASELTDGYSRRNFLQIMGASIALAGLTACRRPVQKMLPHKAMPEEMVAGIPLQYASVYPFQDYASGVLVTTREGRPIKIEGNEEHPESNGATNLFHQAAILDLYDVDRSRNPLHNGEKKSWDDFVSFCADHFSDTGRRIAFISEANSSPTVQRLKNQLRSRFSNADFVTYEPFGPHNILAGTEKVFGRKLRPVYHYDNTDVVVSLDHDFMNLAADNVAANQRFADRRKVMSTDDDMNRLYVVENGLSLTGTNADHRLRIKAVDMPHFVAALAAKLAENYAALSAFSGVSNKFSQHSWISVLAEELTSNEGRGLVTLGAEYAPEAHAAVAAINHALNNTGTTVTYHRVPFHDDSYDIGKFETVVNGMRNGDYDTVVMIGTNPVYTAPFDLNFADALENVSTSIHLADHVDETSKKAGWHVNRAHFLEFWGDGLSYSGARSVIQPTIQPLFGGKSESELLYAILNGESGESYDLVRETWSDHLSGNFDNAWNEVIHDGLQKGSSFSTESVSLSGVSSVASALSGMSEASDSDIEIVFKPDSKLFDGRFANNGWLQELPDPVTKITWDNVALMSKTTAAEFGVEVKKFGVIDFDMVKISVNGREIEMPAWIQPGHADNSITVQVGYGRENVGKVADDIGHNTYDLISSENGLAVAGASVEKLRRTYQIACTQNHHYMVENRPIIREASLDEYKDNPDFATEEDYIPNRGRNLFSDQTFPDYQPQWGMAIDLNSCIGCGVCTIACQAENNIPVIGKREVARNREMHWIRTDRYYMGDEDDPNPKVAHQPVPCMHCEQAPCEQVCPVAATTHSDDGLNQMTYNQCIGTRYCANNCPFKVRRFNFFNYSKYFLEIDNDPEVIQMAMNPDVTVRFRGVMEKCTYCIQRINRAKIATKNETGNSRKPADGMVKTACQQACPTQAISFGDLTDDNSVISRTKANERNYILLGEINVRPRTSYLAKVWNPNKNADLS